MKIPEDFPTTEFNNKRTLNNYIFQLKSTTSLPLWDLNLDKGGTELNMKLQDSKQPCRAANIEKNKWNEIVTYSNLATKDDPQINKYFRKLTKDLTMKEKVLNIKGRKFIINNYYEGIARFDFEDLCAKNIGAEDYIKIAESCNFMVIENIPNFNNDNSNHQQRFITLIDILYEKNITLLVSSKSQLDLITSSKNLKDAFKRTISRIYELTSIKYN